MKTVTPELKQRLGLNLTNVCRLLTITRADGEVFHFTDHDDDIPFDGDIYFASSSFEASGISTQINNMTGELDINIILSDNAISYGAVTNGLFDSVPVVIDLIDYTSPQDGVISVFEGLIVSADTTNKHYVRFRLGGSFGKVARPISERYSPTCRAVFGDKRCKIDLALYTTEFEITTVNNPQQFLSAALNSMGTNALAVGRIEWLTGGNAGLMTDVASNIAGAVNLLYAPARPIAVGDTGKAIRGCQKTVAACKAYNNLANYRGEPYVPGDDGITI